MISTWWILGFLVLERLFELWLAGTNRDKMLARGAREYFPRSYPAMVLMHSTFFVSLTLESLPWTIAVDRWTVLGLGALCSTMLLRYWCIATLGVFWNTRIIVLPGTTLVRQGPYRFMSHPNYLAVTLEMAIIPLLLRAPWTALAFSVLNLVVLRQRIFLENIALKRAEEEGRQIRG